MSFFQKIKEHNAQLLAAQINSNGGKATADVDSIVENLKYLVEKGESFGEETQFIRLDVRRALVSLNDTGRIVFKIEPSSIKWASDDSSVSLGGYLYEVADNGTERVISSFACGGAAREDVYSQDMMTNAQRQASMFSLASARAESNAYYNAGIGIEFKGGDVFDLEAMEKDIPAPEPQMPQPVPAEERKKRTRRKKEEDKTEEPVNTDVPAQPSTEPVSEPTPAPETMQVKPEPVSEPQAETPESEDPTSGSDDMTYEDALNVQMDIGSYAGQTLGVVLSKPQTARNVVWAYKNAPATRSPEVKKALEIAIDGYNGGILKNYLNR